MPLPSLTVTGTLLEILGDVVGGELNESVIAQARVEFESNVPPEVYLKWEGTLFRLNTMRGRFDLDGELVNDDGDPMLLLAQDDGLNVRGLQWRCRVTIPASVIPPSPAGEMRSFWFNATGDGTTIPLGDVVPVVGLPARGVSLGDPTFPWGLVTGKPFDPSTGKLNPSALPDLALTQFKGIKASQSEMLATAGELGDWVIRSDSTSAWIITGSEPTQLSSWTKLPYPDVQAIVDAALLTKVSGTVAAAADGQTTIVNDGELVAANPLFIDPTQAPYNIKFDRITSAAGAMSSTVNPTRLSVSGYTFTSADVGKVIRIRGAGAGGSNLKTTIVGAVSGLAVLASPCLTTITPAKVMFGTDNHDALNLLFDDLSNTTASKLSRTAVMPGRAALFSGTLNLPARGTLKSATDNWTGTDVIFGKSDGAERISNTVLYQMWDQNCDGARVRDLDYTPHDWSGRLQGFALIQDHENTAGKGLNFRTLAGDAVSVIDGGVVDNVSCWGWAEEGFDFANGVVGHGVIRQLFAFANGYATRKIFTADTTSGSTTLTNVSSTTGLAAGDIVSGTGVSPNTVILSVNVGASTLTVNAAPTATGTGVSIHREGAPGVRYVMHGRENVHLNGFSGDQNSGGLLRLVGAVGGAPGNVLITDMKNEYGCNVYRWPFQNADLAANPDVPQGSHAIVLDAMQGCGVDVRGLAHWADASSSVGGTTPNSLGRDIGAAIIVPPTSAATAVPDVTWSGVVISFAAGSGQSVGYVYRDGFTITNQMPTSTVSGGRGSNIQATQAFRLITDANVTVTVHNPFVAWSTLTATRTATLPLLSSVPPGFEVWLLDRSGLSTGAVKIVATPSGSDTLSGAPSVASAYGHLRIVSDGARWIGYRTNGAFINPVISTILDANGNTALALTAAASAVNYLEVVNSPASGLLQLNAKGADTNISLLVQPKGTGGVQVYAATGQTPRIAAGGVDANHDLNFQSKGTGIVLANGQPVGVKVGVPASASATGVVGQWAADANWHYMCIAANTWVRSAAATW